MSMQNYRWKADDEDAATRERREQFEEWAESKHLDLSWETMAYSKFYKNKAVRLAWMAWNAAVTREPLDVPKSSCVHCGKTVISGTYHVCAEMLEYRRNTTMLNAVWPYGGK